MNKGELVPWITSCTYRQGGKPHNLGCNWLWTSEESHGKSLGSSYILNLMSATLRLYLSSDFLLCKCSFQFNPELVGFLLLKPKTPKGWHILTMEIIHTLKLSHSNRILNLQSGVWKHSLIRGVEQSTLPSGMSLNAKAPTTSIRKHQAPMKAIHNSVASESGRPCLDQHFNHSANSSGHLPMSCTQWVS